MKQNLLNKVWLRVWMLVAIMTTALAGTAWAETESVVFSEKGYGNGSGIGKYNATNFSITFEQGTNANNYPKYYTTGTAVRVYGGNTFTVSSETATIEKIELGFGSGDGSNAITTDVETYSDGTWEGSANSVKFTVGGSTGNRRIASITVTYTTGGGGSSAVATTTTIDASGITNTDVYKNTVAGSLAAIVKAGENEVERATVTWSGDNDEVATIDEEGNVTLVAAGTVTFTATYAGVKDEYKGSSDTYEMTVTDTTPVPTHTATFSVNGVTSTQDFEEGAAITFPDDPADVSGKTFVGWVAEAIDGTTDEAPTFVTSAIMGQSDVTYYAVFAYVDGASEAGSVELTPETDGVPSSYGTANTFSEYTFGGVEFQIMQMYKNSGKLQWRAAGNSSGTGTMYNSESLGKIESVVLTYNSSDANKNFTLKVGNTANPTDGEAITPSSNGLVYTFDCSSYNFGFFVLANGSGAGYLDKLVINYTIGSSTISGYCTTVVAAAVARPTIEVAENPFLFSTTATITCETEDATIKYSFDGENWNDYTDALTITATTTLYAKAVKDNDESEVASVTITKNLAVPTIAIDATGITNTNVYDGTEAGNLAASVTYNDAAVEGAAVTWSGNNDEVATIDEEGNVTLVAAGTVTFTATYAGNDDYAEKTATYEMTVTNSDPNAPGSENNPYTVAEAIAFIGTLGSATSATEVYVSGIISQVDSYNSKYGSITYWISDDGTTEGQMEVYSGLNINGEKFSAKEDLQIGDIVTVKGFVKMYDTTPEFDKNNQLVSFERPVSTDPSIAVIPANIEATADAIAGVVAITFENLTNCAVDDFDIQFYDGEGEETDAPDWLLILVEVADNNLVVSYMIEQNDGEARTAYFKVYAMEGEELVYSNLVTVNQAGYVAPVEEFATLPFAWQGSADDGKSSLEAMTGVTAYGLGSDYAVSNAPYRVKLDGTGDYIQVKTDCQPVLVSLDVKMLGGGNTSTITVQESADGETFTDVEELTIEGAQNTILYLQTANAFDAATRYVRLYFTKGSNVGLGGIAIEKEFDVATVGEAGYATYVTKHNVSFPKEVEAYIATSTGYDQIKEEEYVSLTKVTSVAKGTPVVLKNKGEYTLAPVATPESSVEGNMLKASDGTVKGNGTIYVLAKPADKEVGFYAVQKGTTVAEGKAYLEVSKPGVKGFVFAFADQADGIRTLSNSPLKGENIFNLAGQRIQKMQKGINIVNGKKVVLK